MPASTPVTNPASSRSWQRVPAESTILHFPEGHAVHPLIQALKGGRYSNGIGIVASYSLWFGVTIPELSKMFITSCPLKSV